MKETILQLPDDDENLVRIRQLYPDRKIEAIAGTRVTLSKLKRNQSTCWGDGKTYHFRLTKIV